MQSLFSYLCDVMKVNLNIGAGSGLDTVELEDEEVVRMCRKEFVHGFINMDDIL